MKKIIQPLMFLFYTVTILRSDAQESYLPLNRNYTLTYESYLYRTDTAAHTSFRPFLSSTISRYANLDSLFTSRRPEKRFYSRWIGRKLFSEHFLDIKNDDYTIYLDPVFEFRGMLSANNKNEFYYINTRGIQVGGSIGKRFSYYSSFYESQAYFPGYIDSLVRTTRVVPGGGRIKRFYSAAFDYSIASGYISYSLKKHFNFQFGHDKIFIGDGYRSLLLSDHAFNYPFFKISTTFWKINYTNLYTVMQDMKVPVPEEESFIKKYASIHYLSLNITNRLSVGWMEAIIWKSDSVRNRNIDINYLNPVIFLRPVEFSLNSPDNALMGMNLRYTLFKNHVVYGQVMLDEFKLNEVKAGKGWWANKQAFQIGYKAFDLFNFKGLYFLTEFNYVRPYTYQHKSTLTAYSHNNLPLAHPLGANFNEWLTIISLKHKYWFAESKTSVVKIGYDKRIAGNEFINYGQNVLLSYLNHPNDYGNKTGQGITTHQVNSEFRIGYLINPKTNFIIESGLIYRSVKRDSGSSSSKFYYLGIRTALTNRYFDI
jgi:hypothetical protein